MSRRVEPADDRAGNHTSSAREESFVHFDATVFESIADTSGLSQCGSRPRIDRWLDCWSGP